MSDGPDTLPDQVSGPTTHLEHRCPECGNKYPLSVARCPDDGALLSGAESGDDPDEPETIAGQKIDGRFYIGRLIGQGAMGRVYRGSQLSVGRTVAVKVLRRRLSADQKVRARFLREAKLISGFDHPNIVKLIDYGEHGNYLYMVMEYVEGVALQRVIRSRPMTFDFALDVVDQVASALRAAHEAGTVHRDIKPDNVFVVRGAGARPQVKLLDFGIAHVERPTLGVDENLTREGMVFGTPEYMSPEQARGKPVDQATDLYALGVMLFELVTGMLPLQGATPMETMVMQLGSPPPDLREIAPDVPEPIVALIEELMVKERADRLDDAAKVRSRIAAIRRELALPPLAPLPAEADLEAALEGRYVRTDAQVDTDRKYEPVELELGDVVSWVDVKESDGSDERNSPVEPRRPESKEIETKPHGADTRFIVAVLVVGMLVGAAAAALVVTFAA